MTYIDYYLSTATEVETLAAIADLPDGVDVYVLGTWSTYDPATDTSTPVPGHHFNVCSLTPIEWPAGVTQSTPTTPWCVWGGRG